jgi:hypothetical protein
VDNDDDDSSSSSRRKCKKKRKNRKPTPTNLGIKTENKNDAKNKSIQKVVLGNRSVPLLTARAWKAAEKNMGAIPTAGSGCAVIMPHGRSRAKAGTKLQIATTRRLRCLSTS